MDVPFLGFFLCGFKLLAHFFVPFIKSEQNGLPFLEHLCINQVIVIDFLFLELQKLKFFSLLLIPFRVIIFIGLFKLCSELDELNDIVSTFLSFLCFSSTKVLALSYLDFYLITYCCL